MEVFHLFRQIQLKMVISQTLAAAEGIYWLHSIDQSSVRTDKAPP